jgi:hypothetical protein
MSVLRFNITSKNYELNTIVDSINSVRLVCFINYQHRSVAERHVPLSAGPLGGVYTQRKD